MRQIIAFEHISLDGVIQAPGGRDEDPSGGFARGGWIAPYSDDVLGALVRRLMHGASFDLLLGRVTYDIWAPYWPQHTDIWPEASAAVKYIASNTLVCAAWQPAQILQGDTAAQVAEIKRQPGRDLHVWGSANLLQTLLAHDLVDALWLLVYPLTLGAGKRLFGGGALPAAFRLAESIVTPGGVIAANYVRSRSSALHR